MKKIAILLFVSLPVWAEKLVTLEGPIKELVEKSFPEKVFLENSHDGLHQVYLSDAEIERLSMLVHKTHLGCGGFFAAEDKGPEVKPSFYLGKSSPTQQVLVNSLMKDLDKTNIEKSILSFSKETRSRHHRSNEGIDFPVKLKEVYERYANGRSDVSVELIKHVSTPQSSVRARFIGKKDPKKIVVFGGHLDSVTNSMDLAPGADDNASGSSTVLEVFRVLAQSNFQPDFTIDFFGYAAEEAGLIGSNEIAKSYQAAKENVLAVMQLDMVLKKPMNPGITLIQDRWTNAELNKFLTILIDTYVKTPWNYSACGYACSDHASWTKAGYTASFPFETPFNEHNRLIHTTKDLYDGVLADTSHALNFAKLGLSFVVEQSKE